MRTKVVIYATLLNCREEHELTEAQSKTLLNTCEMKIPLHVSGNIRLAAKYDLTQVLHNVMGDHKCLVDD